MALPQHIAIVMDGNGRWAKQRGHSRTAGHKEGANSLKRVVELCLQNQIPYLTVFAFGQDNRKRPPAEIKTLLGLLADSLEKHVDELHMHGVRMRFVGELSALSKGLQKQIQRAEEKTKQNTQLQFNIALQYAGRWDILAAVRSLATQVEQNQLAADAITEQHIADALCLSDCPDPDLLIRTSGEQRLSNFMLWQLSYTELYFTDVPWPEFKDEAFAAALSFYEGRERRFGKITEQL